MSKDIDLSTHAWQACSMYRRLRHVDSPHDVLLLMRCPPIVGCWSNCLLCTTNVDSSQVHAVHMSLGLSRNEVMQGGTADSDSMQLGSDLGLPRIGSWLPSGSTPGAPHCNTLQSLPVLRLVALPSLMVRMPRLAELCHRSVQHLACPASLNQVEVFSMGCL